MEKLKAIKILEDLINTPKVEINEDTIKGLLLLTSNYSYFQMDMLKDALAELEELETKDRLAELEKVILDYYLAKGYQVGVGDWCFRVDIMSHYKNKWIYIYFYVNDEEKEVCKFTGKTTKEMFDKAFECFAI